MPREGPGGGVPSSGAPAPLVIELLGPLEVRVDGGRIDLPARKERALLVALALGPGRPVGRRALASALWGDDPPDSWAKGLQVNVSRVRRRLGDAGIADPSGVLAFHQECYVLGVTPEAVDAHRFVRLITEGRALLDEQPSAAHDRLDAALALWRGDPLVDIAETGAGRGEAARLCELRLGAVEDRFEADLALGRHHTTIGPLEAALAESPLRERLWGQLVVALYRAGRQGDALRAYQRARAVLAEELGIEPGPALRRVEAAVIAQDPALELTPLAPTRPAATLASERAATPPVPAVGAATALRSSAAPPGIDLAADSVELLRELRAKLAPDDPLHDRIRATLVPALMWQGDWEGAVAASQARPIPEHDPSADGAPRGGADEA